MKIILVGGFLGAGKTTLLHASAQRLAQWGANVGLVTNDQAPDLVDTAWLSRAAAGVREVAGSCFCCNFTGFRDAVRSLEDGGAEYVIAEPVGSCTDLSATILQPLKEHHPDWSVAPFSVLVDPARLADVLRERNPRLHADAAYILRLQLEEADRILLSKVDTLSSDARDEMLAYLRREFPHAPVAPVAAATGVGIDTWLDTVRADGDAGTRIVEVDYDRYAQGEAVLGWLNAVLDLQWTNGPEPQWEFFTRALLTAWQDRLRSDASEIGHVKLLLEAGTGELLANLTGADEAPRLRSEGALASQTAALTVNARVQASPEDTERVFREALHVASHGRVSASFRTLHCLRPGRPVPTYRYDAVVPD